MFIRTLLVCWPLMLAYVLPSQAYAATMTSANAQTTNTTETFLKTIFLGDVKRALEYLDGLANTYSRFLDGFVKDEYCATDWQSQEVAQACLNLKKNEENLIKSGQWTHNFHLSQAEFNQDLDGKNIGTYNFVKSIKLIKDYNCRFTMQITAVLNDPQFAMEREFFVECK